MGVASNEKAIRNGMKLSKCMLNYYMCGFKHTDHVLLCAKDRKVMTGQPWLFWSYVPRKIFSHVCQNIIHYKKNIPLWPSTSSLPIPIALKFKELELQSSCDKLQRCMISTPKLAVLKLRRILFRSVPGKRRWVRVRLFQRPACLVPRHRTQPRTGPLCYLSTRQPYQSICNTNANTKCLIHSR